MSTYRTTVASSWPAADAFEYMARFSNAAKWDPGVLAGEDTEPGPPSSGSSYRLVVGVLGRRVRLEYRIEEIDRPRRVVLQAQNATIRSRDVIEVSPGPGGGSRVTYEATLKARGVAILLAPLVGVALRRIGDRAAAGLRTALAA
jgi:carbon monoxide dehydrogenase subunit G